MSIRISSFLGKFGFEARRIAPNLASSAYLKLQFMTRGTIQDQYIKWFMEQDETPMPQVVNIPPARSARQMFMQRSVPS